MDESPTKEANEKAWLWTAVAPLFAVFGVFLSRAATAIGCLLGEAYAGIVNCDRAKMYCRIKRLQGCWAHLKRDIQALIDHLNRQVKRLGHDLMRQVKRNVFIYLTAAVEAHLAQKPAPSLLPTL